MANNDFREVIDDKEEQPTSGGATQARPSGGNAGTGSVASSTGAASSASGGSGGGSTTSSGKPAVTGEGGGSGEGGGDQEYEDNCAICRRPERVAGKMIRIPNNICVCRDCMQKMFDAVGSAGISMDDFENPGDGKAPSFMLPNISMINFSDLPGMQNIVPNNQRLKKKKPKEEQGSAFDIRQIPAPHKIKESLDEYIIGQDNAKKVMSVAVYNHYKRVWADQMEQDDASPNNNKATSVPNNAPAQGQKLNQDLTSSHAPIHSSSGSRIHGPSFSDDVEIEKSNMLMIGPTGCGKTYLVRTLARLLDVPLAITDATSLTEAGYIGDDIESVVSKLLAAADNDVERAEHGIIFIDEIDKIAKKRNTNQRDVSGESVQQGMLKLLEGSEVEVPVGASSKNAMVPMVTVNTRNILFICGGAFPELTDIIKERLNKTASIGFGAQLKDAYDDDENLLSKVTVEDLRNFGMIPEFLGRLPILFTLDALSEDALVRILTEPKNAILRQYQKLLAMDEVALCFEEDALREIAHQAKEKKVGARALRAVIEEFMLDIMYEIPKDDDIGMVTITKEYVQKKGSPKIAMRGSFELEDSNPPRLIASSN